MDSERYFTHSIGFKQVVPFQGLDNNQHKDEEKQRIVGLGSVDWPQSKQCDPFSKAGEFP